MSDDADVHGQLESLRTQVERNRADIDELRGEADLDRKLLAALQSDGIVERQYIGQLEEALTTARKIGAAMGVVIAAKRCTEDEAFDVLAAESMRQNRKLREIADDLVQSGDVASLR
jgi:hypothetical protein